METRRSKPATSATPTYGTATQDVDTQLATSFNDYPELHDSWTRGAACRHTIPELHVVFDFFADNPQKVMPSPVTMDHVRSGEDGNHGGGSLHQDPYWESIRIMQTSDLFVEGMLLRSVDCKRKPISCRCIYL